MFIDYHRLKKKFFTKYFNRFLACASGECSIAGVTHAVKSYYQLLYTSWIAVVSTGFYLKTLKGGENR